MIIMTVNNIAIERLDKIIQILGEDFCVCTLIKGHNNYVADGPIFLLSIALSPDPIANLSMHVL